jgi:hypothetical protein
VTELDTGLAALRALSAPSDLATRYDATLAQSAAVLADVRAAIAQIRHGADPIVSFQHLEARIARALAQANASWRALRIPACVNR